MVTQWMTIAEGASLGEVRALIADRQLTKGTKVRFEMTLNSPVAHLFDLSGAELIFKPAMPEGLILKDVSSPDNKYEVLVEAEADPVSVLAIIAFLKAHWLAISLVAIGITLSLAALVTAIKIKAEVAWTIPMWATIVIVSGFALIAYLAYRGAFRITAGGGST